MENVRKIAICDDEIEIVRGLQDRVMKILDAMGEKAEVTGYTDGNNLLTDVLDIQIVFLDIEMGKMDGIGLGKQIREKNPSCQIIMETGMDHRVREAFFIGAIRSLSKPFVDEDIEEALKEAIGRFIGGREIEVYFKRNCYRIQQSKIDYIRAINSQVELYTSDRIYRKAVSMAQIMEELDARLFFMVNRGIIVNLSKVQTKDMDTLLIGDHKLKVARDRKQAFRQKMMEYEMKYK